MNSVYLELRPFVKVKPTFDFEDAKEKKKELGRLAGSCRLKQAALDLGVVCSSSSLDVELT